LGVLLPLEGVKPDEVHEAAGDGGGAGLVEHGGDEDTVGGGGNEEHEEVEEDVARLGESEELSGARGEQQGQRHPQREEMHWETYTTRGVSRREGE